MAWGVSPDSVKQRVDSLSDSELARINQELANRSSIGAILISRDGDGSLSGNKDNDYNRTYAVDGQQYVAVSTGSGGTSAHFLGLTSELRPSSGNNLFVFALPE